MARELETKLLRGRVRLDEDGSSREMLFRPEGHQHEWPLQNMATSVAELSPLVLYLRHVEASGDALLIDEPESHLHPENRVALAEGLISVARNVSPIIVATHSEFLVSALSNVLLRDQANGGDKGADLPQLAAYAFSFRYADRGLGVDVSEVEVDPSEGFELDQFSEVADDVFQTSIQIYNAIHAESDR